MPGVLLTERVMKTGWFGGAGRGIMNTRGRAGRAHARDGAARDAGGEVGSRRHGAGGHVQGRPGNRAGTGEGRRGQACERRAGGPAPVGAGAAGPPLVCLDRRAGESADQRRGPGGRGLR